MHSRYVANRLQNLPPFVALPSLVALPSHVALQSHVALPSLEVAFLKLAPQSVRSAMSRVTAHATLCIPTSQANTPTT